MLGKLSTIAKRNLSDIFSGFILYLFILFVWMMLTKNVNFSDNRSNADSTSHTDGASTPDVVSVLILYFEMQIVIHILRVTTLILYKEPFKNNSN